MAVAPAAAAAEGDEPARVPPGGVLIGQTGDLVIDSEGRISGVTSAAKVCSLWASPNPQYSASNHTIHWGVNVICNYAPFVDIHVYLYSRAPYGPGFDVEEDDAVAFGAGSQWAGSTARCLDWGGSRNWRMKTNWHINGDPGSPNPAYSSYVSLPCQDAI
jgi:hypothetical protein